MKRMSPDMLVRYKGTESLNERIAIMDKALESGGCFGKSEAKSIRTSMELSLMRWRLAKRQAANLPMLANVSWNVSDLLDDLTILKTDRGDIELELSETKHQIEQAMEEVKMKVQKIRARLGIDLGRDTFSMGQKDV